VGVDPGREVGCLVVHDACNESAQKMIATAVKPLWCSRRVVYIKNVSWRVFWVHTENCEMFIIIVLYMTDSVVFNLEMVLSPNAILIRSFDMFRDIG